MICRFINADGYASTGTGFLGYNMFAYCENNPVAYSDPTGCILSSISSFVATAVDTIVNSVKAMVPVYAGCGTAIFADGPLPFGDIAGLTIAAAVTIGVVVGGIAQAVKTTSNTSPKSYTVYALTDSGDNVQYIGRTSNPSVREAAHGSDPYRMHLDFTVLHSGLDYNTARGLEQAYMLYHHTLNTFNKMNNQINGISPINPKISIYVDAAKDFLNNYGGNQISNALLCWSER